MKKSKNNRLFEIRDFLTDEQVPIKKRLQKYNEIKNLAFISFPGFLIPPFAKVFKDNPRYKKAFDEVKDKAIKEIREKRLKMSYKDFVRYLFFDLGQTADHYGRVSLQTHENDNQSEPFVYDIVPENAEQAKFLEEASVEHMKAKPGNLFRYGLEQKYLKTLIAGYNSFEDLTAMYEQQRSKPFAEKNEVIRDFKDRYINPLKKEWDKPQRLQALYKSIKKGEEQPWNFISNYYLYYTDKATIVEIIKFERFLNDEVNNYSPRNSTPQQTEPELTKKGKPGRKKTMTKKAREYLKGFIAKENKDKFLVELKSEYKGVEPKAFNHLIIALKQMGKLKEVSNKAIKESFEIAIEPKKQNQSNFNATLKKAPDAKIIKSIKQTINEIIEKNTLV